MLLLSPSLPLLAPLVPALPLPLFVGWGRGVFASSMHYDHQVNDRDPREETKGG